MIQAFTRKSTTLILSWQTLGTKPISFFSLWQNKIYYTFSRGKYFTITICPNEFGILVPVFGIKLCIFVNYVIRYVPSFGKEIELVSVDPMERSLDVFIFNVSSIKVFCDVQFYKHIWNIVFKIQMWCEKLKVGWKNFCIFFVTSNFINTLCIQYVIHWHFLTNSLN